MLRLNQSDFLKSLERLEVKLAVLVLAPLTVLTFLFGDNIVGRLSQPEFLGSPTVTSPDSQPSQRDEGSTPETKKEPVEGSTTLDLASDPTQPAPTSQALEDRSTSDDEITDDSGDLGLPDDRNKATAVIDNTLYWDNFHIPASQHSAEFPQVALGDLREFETALVVWQRALGDCIKFERRSPSASDNPLILKAYYDPSFDSYVGYGPAVPELLFNIGQLENFSPEERQQTILRGVGEALGLIDRPEELDSVTRRTKRSQTSLSDKDIARVKRLWEC